MFLILLVGKYIDVWDIVLVAALQIISSAIYFLITRKRINKGIFKAKKSSKTNINIAIISGASFAGMRMGRMLRGMNSSLAATLAMIGFTCIAVLCSVIATMHIMKFYYCKKYGINCGKGYETTSPLLVAEKKERNESRDTNGSATIITKKKLPLIVKILIGIVAVPVAFFVVVFLVFFIKGFIKGIS